MPEGRRTVGAVIDQALAEGRTIPLLIWQFMFDPWRCSGCRWEGPLTELLMGPHPEELLCPVCRRPSPDLLCHKGPRLTLIQGGRR